MLPTPPIAYWIRVGSPLLSDSSRVSVTVQYQSNPSTRAPYPKSGHTFAKKPGRLPELPLSFPVARSLQAARRHPKVRTSRKDRPEPRSPVDRIGPLTQAV